MALGMTAKKGWVKIILLLLSLLTVGISLYQSRWIFSYNYEPEYYENLYYHSQWNIPGSSRGISDGELYKFVGYKLAQGENPFNINFEVPPLAKYFYGLAEMYLGNPYWVSLFFYAISVFALWKISLMLFERSDLPWYILLLFVSTPFVATQIKETMLDLPLMSCLLLHLWMMTSYLKSKSVLSLSLAGIFLGLFTGIKIGVYSPLILILGMTIVLLSSKKIVDCLRYLIMVGGGYVLSFFCYFVKHPNPLPWLRLHEKPIGFYRDSMGVVDHWNQWRSIFTNTYHGFWEGGKFMSAGDWSWLLPIGVVLTVWVLFRSVTRRDWVWTYISGIIVSVLLINTMIPFWTRYLMPIIPMLVLIIGKALDRKRLAIYLMVILTLLNISPLLDSLNSDKIGGNVDATVRFFSTRANRELYRSMDQKQRLSLNEENFVSALENFFETIGTRGINVEILQINVKGNNATVPAKITYTTHYGQISHEPILEYKKINNQWKLDWKWNYLWDGYQPETKIVVDEGDIGLEKIVDNKNALIAKRGVEKVLYVTPRLISDWTGQLNKYSVIVGEDFYNLDKTIKRNIPDKYPRFVNYVNQRLVPEELKRLAETDGVVIKEIRGIEIVDKYKKDDNILRRVRELRSDKPDLFYISANIYMKFKDRYIKILENKNFHTNSVIIF